MGSSLGRVIVGPTAALAGKLKLAGKALIVITLLLIPLGVVLADYVGQQNSQISTTNQEKSGVVYLTSVDQLMNAVVVSRDATMSGNSAFSNLSSTISAVDSVDAQLGGVLGVHNEWQSVKGALSNAQAMTGGASSAAFRAWNSVADDISALITKVADNSSLSLDPQLDTFYLQTLLAVNLPSYLDNAGRAVIASSLGSSFASPGAIAEGAASNSITAVQADISKIIGSTHDTSLISQLTPFQQTSAIAQGRGIAGIAGNVGNLESIGWNGLNSLLTTRISSLQSGTLRNEVLAIVTAALALWMAAGILVQSGDAALKLMKSMEKVAQGDVTVQTDLQSHDEFGTFAIHLNAALAKIRGSLQVISEKMESVFTSSQDLSSVSALMSGTAEITSERAAAVSSASEQVNTNVTVVAAAIEEMVASVKEIASNASKASEVATRASEIASVAGENIGRLEASSIEISNVVSLITSIAEQTNLLALNATIEAARAGEMGKGFAVVANEVKDLAAKTTKATEDISHRIEAIQANTQGATESVTQIRQIVEEINDIQGSIASSVEEQAAAVSEVGRSVSEAAGSTAAIVENITGVARSAQETSDGADRNQESAQQVSAVSSELQSLIGSLLGQFHFENGSGASGTKIEV